MKIRIDMPNSDKRNRMWREFNRMREIYGLEREPVAKAKADLDAFDAAETERLRPSSEAIEAALLAVNGKASAHTITSAREVRAYVARAEAMFDNAGLGTSFRKGAKLRVRGAGPTAKSYGYKVKTTFLQLERGGTHWFLTAVGEDTAYPKQSEQFALMIDEDQANTIRKAAVAPFVIA